jgi:hypothetical protein
MGLCRRGCRHRFLWLPSRSIPHEAGLFGIALRGGSIRETIRQRKEGREYASRLIGSFGLRTLSGVRRSGKEGREAMPEILRPGPNTKAMRPHSTSVPLPHLRRQRPR